MIGIIAARLGLAVSKPAAAIIGAMALAAIAAIGLWRGLAAIDRMTAAAAASATASCEARWRAEIEASNAEVQKRTAELSINAAAASAAAEAEIARLQSQLTELETRNAALPNGGARGLDRDRVRLLNDQ